MFRALEWSDCIPGWQATKRGRTPPAISVNLGQHDPEIPVARTAGSHVADKQADDIASALRQSGLVNVALQHIDTTPLINIAPDEAAPMRYRARRPPHYPGSAIRAREQGTVVFKVHISGDGDALGAKAADTGVSADLVKASLAAALTWKYAEGKDAWARVPLKYELGDSKRVPVKELPELPPGQEWRWSADGKRLRTVPAGELSD